MTVQTTYSNKPGIAYRGMLADLTGHQIVTGLNEEAADMNFGSAVKQGTAGDQKKLPTTGAAIVGVTAHQHGGIYNRDLTSSATAAIPAATGKAGSPGVFGNLVKGRIWTTCRGGCAVDGAVFVQITTNGARIQGDFAGTDDGANAEACSQARWKTAASDGELAVLEVDFSPNRGALT